ncbi:hypothetical protein SAMN03080615_00700 [Amphritea atlantica]|uniref:Uncharacterized protein n=1 Tax=Amphritea atlantica TaxID=355243 RepID=A0A1H9E5A7_9GAMM|nr:hypothetical protein SAMN03080615_00700 [Amphritea atlantica]
MSESRRLLLLNIQSRSHLAQWQACLCRMLLSGVYLLQRAVNCFDQKLAEQISKSEETDSARH